MKTTFGFLKYALLCVAMFAFAACSNDDDDADNGGSGEIVIAEDLKTIACTGSDNDSKSITFTAKNDWTAIASHSWIDLSKRTGSAGDNTIIITIEDNDDFKTRIGTVTIKDKVSGKSIDIIITQGEKGSVFTITGTDGNPKSQGGTLIINNESQVITDTILVASNYDYTVKTDAVWLTYEKISDNGSTKYVFHADPAKLYADTKYQEKTTKVSFEYLAATRAPATQTYDVKFAGITPSLVADASPVVLEDNGDGYKATIHLTSNVKWDLGANLAFATARINGENKSKQYFETSASVTFTYNKDELQVEEESADFTFVDEANKVLDYSLKVTYPGTGNDYVYLDLASFNLGDNRMHTFEAFGAPGEYAGMYENVTVDFKVKAADKNKVAFYLVRQSFAGAPLYATYMDDYQEEQSTNIENKWGWVEDATPTTRTLVETITKTLSIKSRGNELDGTSVEGEERFFAFLAVSSEKYPKFADLFDADGNLKPELDGTYVYCSQKAAATYRDFVCEGLNNQTIQFAAAGETKTFDYSGIDISDEKWATSWNFGDFSVVDGNFEGDPVHFGWTEPGSILTGVEYEPFDANNKGKIKLTVGPNTTGAVRSLKYAIYYGSGDYGANGLIYPVYATFTIEQAAN